MLSGRALSEARRGAVLALVLTLTAVGVVFAHPYLLQKSGLWVDGGEPTISPTWYTPPPSPTPSAVAPTAPLTTIAPGKLPVTAALGAKITGIPRTGIGKAGVTVIDPTTGTLLYGEQPDTPMTPASTLKTLTSAAALAAMGPDHRFATTVVSAEPGQIVLVGGGDPLLRGTGAATYPARASIVDLAESTAAALKKAGQTTVALAYDDTLFTGPGWNPTWLPGYAEFATPTSALWLDRGIVGGIHGKNPSGDAAATFATQLRERGITVTATTAAKAPAGAATVAEVWSLPLDLIVQELLLHSDNDITEVLFRHVAIADGRPGSITEASAAVQARLEQLGLWQAGMKLDDGSGLSRGNLATPRSLAKVVTLALEDPRYRAIATGMPTAASDGTLGARFDDPATEGAGRGQVRAKTGTLTGVHTFNGFTRTADGALVTFAFVTNDVAGGADLAARDWLERVSAATAACGCS
ncbi:MAG TPA: D-alanyl-D-alanine carboxypeptidase/D-alanyl-D-alanine-endopeptidase [Propionibacteriaceae bacterium]|nr:D-alanyl-D-alanine carboxypeptidase/D-alanyl-D-alanine-endopeptidase [Propionibacteriaceae bacterium]